jgi:hypothetical protein
MSSNFSDPKRLFLLWKELTGEDLRPLEEPEKLKKGGTK